MNPAVTLAFAVVRRLPWKKVPVYWAAQMLGAFVASACVYGVYYGRLSTTKIMHSKMVGYNKADTTKIIDTVLGTSDYDLA